MISITLNASYGVSPSYAAAIAAVPEFGVLSQTGDASDTVRALQRAGIRAIDELDGKVRAFVVVSNPPGKSAAILSRFDSR